jgi:FkbM family methyltransferase
VNWSRQVRCRSKSLFRRLAPEAKISYAGHGEDLLAWGWLSVQGGLVGPAVRYVDIGAAHPTKLSNTYLLSTLGARGVLVEPDPNQAAKLQAKRPGDITINAGIAFDERQSATLIRLSSPLFNTFSEQQADMVVASSKNWDPPLPQTIMDRIEVRLFPINKIFEDHGTPHFLSIDAEGADFQILKSIDFSQFRPWIICMEIMNPLEDIDETLRPHGYQLFCRTPDNVMFILNPLPSSSKES